ncbi:MAG TPA: HAD-IB family hydrolase, partial [Mycobacteriales bacterium]|nr:HAD-IB family hydrolase [Mycobacteriales bacterium]
RRDFLTMRDIVRFAVAQARFIAVGEHQNLVAETQTRALAFIAGRSVAEMRSVGEEVFDELLADKIWPGTLALARMHQDAGQRVWLVTATPVELASIIARRLGLTGALGTVAEVVDGEYTGRLVGEPLHGPAKAAAVLALADRERLDLDRCAAYSDSINDLPMLSTVGRAVAVNPDSALRMEARARGWEIRDFRTGRKAARVGVPAAIGAGAVGGGVAAGVRLLRKRGS